MIEFKLPELGENVRKADVIRVLVAEGDEIQHDQGVLDIESEKAAMSLPCPHAGKIAKIHVREGDQVTVGQVLLSIEESGDGKKTEAKAAPAPARKEKPPARKPEAPAAARETKEPAKEQPPRAPEPAPPAEPEPEPAAAEAPREGAPLPAGPATRRLARELGVDLGRLQGSGPGGRITRDDVQEAVRGHLATSPQRPGALPDFAKWGPIKREPLNALARTAARHLHASWQTVPQVTQHGLADITDLEAGRKRLPPEPKVTLTAMALKAIVAVLRAFPQFNSSYDAENEELVLKGYYHIGVAVDTPRGLVVPVIRNVDQRTIRQLAVELAEKAEKARERTLRAEDMQGGTFTLSNLGGIGGTSFTPLVNHPEVAILGIARAQQQLQERDGKIQTRLMLPLSLSYDHRVINGADGARFVTRLAELLSDPVSLLMEV